MADEMTADIWRQDDKDVFHPSHYTSGDIECIDAIKASMGKKEYAGFLKGQVLKYMWRYEKKDKPLQDLQKAGWYLAKLQQFVDEEHPYAGRHGITVDYISSGGDQVLPEVAERLRDALEEENVIPV